MYLPSTQITTNLYTNGGEYALSTTREPYKGYYFKTYQNKLYTGKTPNDLPNVELINITDIVPQLPSTPTITQPDAINPVIDPQFILRDTKPRYLPQSIVSLPTSNDYQTGYFTRYFCKKNNELKYIETDETTHNKLQAKDASIAWDLYTPTSVNWYIVGDEKKTYLINKTTVQLIERDSKWYGFTNWFRDNFAKYLAL